MLAGGEIAKRVRPRAEIVIGVGKIGLGADDPDLELSAAPALADAGIENGRLFARVRAHDQKRVGLFDTGNGRIEDVGGAPRLATEGVAALNREIDGAAFRKQLLQRKHLLDRGEIARDRSDPLAVDATCFRRDGRERLGP
ncbi:hypothetical protein GALL_437730 [mine drainage metagenome]|uniref:Uncharacterized protein n=1 Tax=mine drainage metagenome TaxID=410659 RepID=A0A1J5PTV4_9ZZZZ